MNLINIDIPTFEVAVKEIDHNCELKMQQSDDVLTVFVPKALTAIESKRFINTVNSVIETSTTLKAVDLNFSITEFIDSSGLGAMVNVINSAKLADCEVAATGLNDDVQSLLKMTRLDQLIHVRHH